MGIKSTLIRPYAKRVIANIKDWSSHSDEKQARLAKLLIDRASLTTYGRKHQFQSILMHKDFSRQIPVMTKDDLQIYLEQYLEGEQSLLWPGSPKYLMVDKPEGEIIRCVSREAVGEYFSAGKKILLYHAIKKANTGILDHKFLHLTGPIWSHKKANHTAATLDSIINENIPPWVRPFQLPSRATNRIAEKDKKIIAIVEETQLQKIRSISGSAENILRLYKAISDKYNVQSLSDHYSKLELVIVNTIGSTEEELALVTEAVGNYPNMIKVMGTNDGILAFQDKVDKDDMLLYLDNGIFYEFLNDSIDPCNRLWLDQVKTGQPYEILISNNSGLWSFKTGIWVEFTKTKPYRIRLVR